MQLCAGQIAGVEAAIHAVNIAMEDDAVEAAVFVNASIAFNNLTREAALRNIQSVWPTLAIIATNTYIEKQAHFSLISRPFNQRTQPKEIPRMTMAIYAIAACPLIYSVHVE